MTLKGKPRHGEKSLVFGRHESALPAMLASAGRVREVADYDWHGLRRGNVEFAVVQYTLAGGGILEWEGAARKIGSGELFVVVVPHDHRYYLPAGGRFWEFVYAVLHGREALRVIREIVRRFGPVLTLSRDSRTVAGLLDTARAAAAGRIATPFEASRHAWTIAMNLSGDIFPRTTADGRVPGGILAAREFARENFTAAIDVAELADVAGLSRCHFARTFRKWIGSSPAAYVLDLRLRRSVKLLEDPSVSVKTAAYSSGFNDYNYFCRAFRKRFGISPGRFRKSGMY